MSLRARSSPGDTSGQATSRTWRVRLGLLAVLALAFGLRSLTFPGVFVGEGEAILRMDDSQYHARRALYTFARFPRVLDRDTYLNFPQGANVPWPPLYDFTLGAVARLFGRDASDVPAVIAWVPVALGTLTALLVYALARTVAGPGTALGSAAIFALLRASVIYTDVGNPDHHAAVALLGAALLLLHAVGARAATRGGTLAAVHAGLVVARVAMLLSWHGSLLYLAIGETTAIAVLTGAGRRDALLAQAAGALATAALATPAVLRWGPSLGGPYSTIELSWLHVVVLLGVAASAWAIGWLEAQRPAGRWTGRLLRGLAVGLLVGVCVLLIPGVSDGVAYALSYFGKETPWIAGNTESQPIFRDGSTAIAVFLYGGFAFLLPLAPLAALARARVRRVREPALVLAAWTLALGSLALTQSRYGNDFAPGAAVGLSLLLRESGLLAARALPRTPLLARALPVLVGAGLVWPLVTGYASRVPTAVSHLHGEPSQGDPALDTMQGTAHRFAQQVRAATPETGGFLDPGVVPDYGVLCFATMGHLIQHVAHRPTTSDNFGPYLLKSNLRLTNGFYAIKNEESAIRLAERLRVRYVITAEQGRPRPMMMLHRLHRADGTGRYGGRRLERFRLVTEGPGGGVSIGRLTGRPLPPGDVPYKLFEIVAGALLEVSAADNVQVIAEVDVETPIGRRFTYRASSRTDERGIAHLRIPYATDTHAPARPIAPYRVIAGRGSAQVTVTDADVQGGATVRVFPVVAP